MRQTDNLGPASIAQLKGRARKFPEILSQVEEEELKSEVEGCHQDVETNELEDAGIIEKH